MCSRCPYGAYLDLRNLKQHHFTCESDEWVVGISPPALPPPELAKKNLVAAKCNLCENTPLNPPGAASPAYSCEENCPTGALVRVNPLEYFDEVEQRLGRVFRNETMLAGRNIHRRDPIRRWCHFIGSSLILLTLRER